MPEFKLYQHIIQQATEKNSRMYDRSVGGQRDLSESEKNSYTSSVFTLQKDLTDLEFKNTITALLVVC